MTDRRLGVALTDHAAPPLQSTARNPPTTGVTFYGCGLDEAVLVRESARRLGVSPRITAAGPSEATLDLVDGNLCVSVGHKTPVTDEILRALARVGVEYLSTRSICHDHVDLYAARSSGIHVETVAYSPDSVADYTLMLILMALRQAPTTVRRVARHDYRLPVRRGRELRDLTVGVVGTGRIGSAVVDRLRGFGGRVLAHDLVPTPDTVHVRLEELLTLSDVVTLHTPLDATTRRLLDRRRLGQMRQGAVLVNTGRGALVDTEALTEALESGRLGAAALDVLEGEQGIFYTDRRDRDVDHDLLLRLQALPNVQITPHVAYYTDHALADAVENSLLGCLAFARHRRTERGEEPPR